MRDLLLNPELRLRMERLGAQRAALFSWERNAAKTLDLYYSVGGAQISAPELLRKSVSAVPLMSPFTNTFSHDGSLLLVALTAIAAPLAESTLPNEVLRYSVNWPTGVSLGEAQLSASSSGGSSGQPGRMHFQFDVDASAPAFTVSDRYAFRCRRHFLLR